MPRSTLLLARASTDGGLHPLSFGRFVLGCLVVVLVVGAVVAAASTVRRECLPAWRGAPARLAESVIGVAIIAGNSLALGAAHQLTGWPLFLGIIGTSVVLGASARRWGHRSNSTAGRRTYPLPGLGAGRTPASSADVGVGAADDRERTSGMLERAAAVLAVVVVGAQWISHTTWALGHGMTEGDTLWYHGVFAARFVQEGRLDFFPDLGAAAQGFFPANSQMLHAVAFLPFDRDLLSPILNLAFGGLAVLAAFCIGRRRGVGAICVTASAAVLGLPAIVGTHPGQATNDIACAALLLAALALIIEGSVAPIPIGLAAIAGALALGTKLTVAVPLTVLTIAIVVIAIRRKQFALVLAWVIPLVAIAGFWFARNWIRVGNPLPWYDLRIGPIHFPARSFLSDNASVADRLFETQVWSEIFRPGMRLAFGRVWPLFAAAPGIAALLVFGRDRRTEERLLGAVTVAAGVGYLTMPFTMELGGVAFSFTARYASPALLTGLVVVPLAVGLGRAGFRRRVLASAIGLGVVIVNAAAEDLDRFAPWRLDDRFFALMLACGVALLVAGARWGGRPARALLVAPVALAVVLGGYAVQRNYLTHRYAVGTGLKLDRFNEFLSRNEGTRVAAFDTVQFSPLFGPSFASTVLAIEPPPPSARSAEPVVRCREWQSALDDARPRFVLFASDGVPVETPDRKWIARSPSVTVVERDRSNTLYEVRGRLRLACP